MNTAIELAISLFIVAHRGASGDAPENTLPAFELAWEQGADAIEGDFHLTKDNRIACIHDYDTTKVAGTKLVVADSTFEELRKLDVGSWKSPKFAGTRIPSLEEVIATIPEGKKLYLEVKCGPEIVPTLAKTLAASELSPEQLVVISFNEDFVRQWKTAEPESRTMLLISFNRRVPRLSPSLHEVIEKLKDTGADGVSTNTHPALDANFVEGVKAADFEYHSWTINEADKARELMDMGSQSITTDFPGQLRSSLEPKAAK